MQDIKLMEGDVWGHRKDISEYYEISQRVFDNIKQYKSEGMPEADIIEKLKRETKMGHDLIAFLVHSN